MTLPRPTIAGERLRPASELSETRAAASAFESALQEIRLYALVGASVHPSLAHRACWFCGCLPPAPPLETAPRRDYLDCVAAEIAIVADRLKAHGRLASVMFGAGAPSPLTPAEIKSVLDAIEDSLGLTDTTSLSIEATCDMILDDDARSLISTGVRRFTLFVESKAQPFAAFDAIEQAIGRLRDAGAEDVGVAYFADLPSRKPAEPAEQTEQLIALGPDRIVVHRMVDRTRADPAFAGLPAPAMCLEPEPRQMIRAAGFLEAGDGVFIRPERRLAAAAALDSHLAAARIGLGAGALGRVGRRLYRNARRMDLYAGLVEMGNPPIECAAEAPAAAA